MKERLLPMVAKCSNKYCDIRMTCYRYTAKDDCKLVWWFTSNNCDGEHFMSNDFVNKRKPLKQLVLFSDGEKEIKTKKKKQWKKRW